jgi:hypothetical protein
MKISDATFRYLFKAAIQNQYRDAIKVVLEGKRFEFSGEYSLSQPVNKELMNIAKEFDPEYDCVIDVGELADIYVMIPEMLMYTRLAGDPAPYAEQYGDEDEDDDYGFDAIGEWTINLNTKKVEFDVDVTT